jgi:hypothetical protein
MPAKPRRAGVVGPSGCEKRSHRLPGRFPDRSAGKRSHRKGP